MARLTGTVELQDGTVYTVTRLLGNGKTNVKLAKSDKAGRGFLTFALSLAPAKTSGYNLCQGASPGCTNACIFYTGRGPIPSTKRGRIAKARLLIQDKPTFRAMLWAELTAARNLARKRGLKLAVRLNVVSDVPWERVFPELFADFRDVQFYDYTKVAGRTVPRNYYLTFSRSEINESQALAEYARGVNVAVVFSSKALPKKWNGIRVFSGDQTDLRFLDKRGIVGLYVKHYQGPAGNVDTSGFVVPTGPAVPSKAIRLTVAA